MRYIINGKRYDTETATRIAEDSFSNPSDFHYWEETLYRTRKGAFFLVGEGGPLTQYARRVDTNSTCGGSAVRVLTVQEALEWCESHHVDADTIAEHFGDMLEEG